MEADQVVIEPFVPENLNGSSYDVRVGEWFYRTGVDVKGGIYNPYSEEAVREYFGEPERARPNAELMDSMGRLALQGIPDDHPIIILEPGERVLAHTQEFIGIRPPGTTSMQARSTWGRNGLAVCFCAGWGDPGYVNRWTMELYNLNRVAMPVAVGERLSQMVFYETGEVESSYEDLSGKYQGGTELADLQAQWEPSQMLPRSHKDIERLVRGWQ